MPLADEQLSKLLERLAQRTPAPGGGTAAALTGATAAALIEMAASFARTRAAADSERVAPLQARAGELRGLLLELAEADLGSYEPVLDALARDRGEEGRAAALEGALSAAADTPLQVAAGAAELAELGASIARAPGNESLAGDARAGTILAEAATAAAAQLVAINLARHPDDPRLGRAGELARRAAQARASLATG